MIIFITMQTDITTKIIKIKNVIESPFRRKSVGAEFPQKMFMSIV